MHRCFLCAADMLGSTERSLRFPDGTTRSFALACGSCGVLLVEWADPVECRRDLEARLRSRSFAPGTEAPYGLDTYTLRTAATSLGRGLVPRRGGGRAELLAPHGVLAGQGTLFDLAPGRGGVALGVLCRPGEVEAVLSRLPPHASWTDEVVILVDAPFAEPQPVAVEGFSEGGVRMAARPLGGDFGAQRNVLQELADNRWMLQLDADEDIAPEVGALLPAVAALADEGEAVSVGLARRNLVDGVLSAMYPDVQYRLNRTGTRYTGEVHERPAIGGWQRGFISLHGTIVHHLDGDHVRARSQRYEAMAPGRGRLEETARLLSPFEG